jgi:hypothetical protein
MYDFSPRVISADPSVPNGASGFACNTIGGTVTVTSVSGTVTALVPTAAAAQFNAATSVYNPYGYASSSYPYTTNPLYTGTGGTYYGTTYGLGSAVVAPLAAGVIAVIAIFGVGYGCWYIAAGVVIFSKTAFGCGPVNLMDFQ